MPLSKAQIRRKTEGKPRGRPTKYRKEYAQQIVAFCSKGFSLTAFAASIGSFRQQIDWWSEQSQEFCDAVNRARASATLYWEKIAHRNANRGASGGQVAMTIFMLKNFGKEDFGETIKHTGPDGGPLSLELLLGKLNQPDVISVLPAETSSQTPLFITDSREQPEVADAAQPKDER